MQISRWFHSFVLGVLVSLTMLLAACGGSTATSPYTAEDLIQKASTNFAQDTALHFTLTAKDIVPGLYAVTAAEGDVVRPDKLKIIGSDMVSKGGTLGIGIIIIGANQYVDLGNIGKYHPTTGLPNLLAIFSPTEGIGSILNQLQSPSKPTADTVGGVACWKVNGTVTSSLLAPITGSSSTISTPVATQIWVGQTDLQIHQVTLTGKAADGDLDTTARTFVLSKFNETIAITAPNVTS
ncbi:MAG: LppX_LprAFG lipoprotein [Ktedonobacterales bacterium]|nr:LppX_LprAFG lipoprotein [Ktedonobacterales bacterium]